MRLFLLGCFAFLLGGCSMRTQLRKELTRMESELQESTGFALYDPHTGKYLMDYHADRYFTPASNTKIFTFYTSLNILGDSVPAIAYEVRNDTLAFRGLGDPSFLYAQSYHSDRVYRFLSGHNGPLVFSSANFHTERFGPGWAWDDYHYYYSPERSSFPIYGNVIHIEKDSAGQLNVIPRAFRDSTRLTKPTTMVNGPVRKSFSNHVTLHAVDNRNDSWDVPMHYSDRLFCQLLSDTLHRTVSLSNAPFRSPRVLKSVPLDSLLRVMMQESDNFIAEQLLLQCSYALSDTLQPEIAIRYAMKNLLQDLPDEPQWVDGSGLSRYNLFTPRSIVKLWEKIDQKVPQDRLFPLLATGGTKGTIKKYFKKENPYIFGKTGSLSNNHCLSGFLIARSGRKLIFSFMHNNFVQPTRKVRTEMEKFLNRIYEKY